MKNMIKGCILAAATMLSLASCSKEIDAPASGNLMTFKARIEQPAVTKTEFAEGTQGISAKFQEGDVVIVIDSEGNATNFTATSVSSDGVATFEGEPETPIAAGASVTAVLKGTGISYDKTNKQIVANLANQAGTLEDAGKRSLFVATGTNTNSGLSLSFSIRTSILKCVLTLPSSDASESGYNWYLSTGGTGSKDYKNKITVDLDGTVALDVASQEGDLKVAGNLPFADGKATVYFAVPSTQIKNGIIQCTPSSDQYTRYVWHLAGATALTPAEGCSYTVTRNQSVVCYSSQNAGSMFLVNNSATTVNGTALPANTTGKPKTTVLAGDVWGYRYPLTVCQAELSDFLGNYTFKGDTRKATVKGTPVQASATVAPGTGGSKEYPNPSGQSTGSFYDNVWTAPAAAANTETPVTVTASGNSPYNVVVNGLFENLPMPGKIDLDYTNHTLSACLYIENKTYAVTSGLFSGEYAMFATELRNSPSGYWQLGYANGGAFEYAASTSVSAEGSVTFKFAKDQQCQAFTKFVVVGFLVNRFVTSTGNGANLVRSTKSIYCYDQKTSGGSAYAWVTQGDFTMTK